MTRSLSTVGDRLSVDDLREAGFTEEEIEQLSALRNEYPFVEYVDSGRQWQRLLFLKWRYDRGDLRRA